MPESTKPEQNASSKEAPDSLPSLPTAMVSTFSFLHLLDIAKAISLIESSFNSSGYVPLMSFSLNIDLVTFIFSPLVI